ncbi:Oidioi.mRNA.OKI2018_I69.XSR.g14305.t2.cds [Oikopleura dioica]|uniref:SURF1-like protein n=1 Tax=Oikopleura dioica TaxID=34765 RepID=A0ABN7SED7_OIKDI|nr:Oidioi.mRNA.OKI2018_I69.XSR.g14305.t2.cds [Oikopleura dioica]
MGLKLLIKYWPGIFGIPLTAKLGHWQYNRRDWKEGIIKRSEERPLMEPLDGIPSDFAAKREEYEFRRIRLSGKYDSESPECIIHPRTFIPAKDEDFSKINVSMRTGAHVISPFVTEDGRRILVNRGFVSLDRVERSFRDKGQSSDTHSIGGIIRLDDDVIKLHGQKPRDDGTYKVRDVTNMSKDLDTEEIFIDLDRESTLPGGPIGGQTKLSFSNNHLIYCIQWWSLTAFITFYTIRTALKMSRIVYVGAAAQRVKTISKSLSVVPPALGATIAIKWTKIMALAPLVKYSVLTLTAVQFIIPVIFYHTAKRYIFQMKVYNQFEEDEKYEVLTLSPSLWTTRKTTFTTKEVAFPDNPEALTSFIVNGRRLLWDQHNVTEDDYDYLTRFASGIDYENLDSSIAKQKEINDLLNKRKRASRRNKRG